MAAARWAWVRGRGGGSEGQGGEGEVAGGAHVGLDVHLDALTLQQQLRDGHAVPPSRPVESRIAELLSPGAGGAHALVRRNGTGTTGVQIRMYRPPPKESGRGPRRGGSDARTRLRVLGGRVRRLGRSGGRRRRRRAAAHPPHSYSTSHAYSVRVVVLPACRACKRQGRRCPHAAADPSRGSQSGEGSGVSSGGRSGWYERQRQ